MALSRIDAFEGAYPSSSIELMPQFNDRKLLAAVASSLGLGTFRSEYETQWSLLMAASGVYGVDVIGVDQATGDEFTDYLVVVQTGDELRIDEVLPLSQDEN